MERFLRLSQATLNSHHERMRAAEYAPRGRFRLLERRHGLAEMVERGAVGSVERLHRVNAAGNGTSGWRVVVSSGSRHGAAVLRETNALDEVVRPFATSVEAAAAALVARVKRSN